MSEPRITRAKAVSPEQQASRAQKLQSQLAKFSQMNMQQVDSERNFTEWCEEGFNEVNLSRNFKTLDEIKTKRKEKTKTEQTEPEEEVIEDISKAEESASRFQKNNPELESKTLLSLKEAISQDDTLEEIVEKILNFYPDQTLADEAIDFLIETAEEQMESKFTLAKQNLNSRFSRQITAGQNIRTQAQEFAKDGLGTPSTLRDMYRDITGNPKAPNVLFELLSKQYPFEKMKSVISFLLHSLGADLKSKGPSISRAELQRLLEDTRTLQAILGLYRFFKSRMGIINAQFNSLQLTLPAQLTFDNLAKLFMKLLQERYLSSEKVLLLSRLLGISKEAAAEIIVYTQMRDAIRQVAPKLFKSDKHRQDTLEALMEALEELEEDLEEEEEDEKEK